MRSTNRLVNPLIPVFIEESPPFFNDRSKIFHTALDAVGDVRNERGDKTIKIQEDMN